MCPRKTNNQLMACFLPHLVPPINTRQISYYTSKVKKSNNFIIIIEPGTVVLENPF